MFVVFDNVISKDVCDVLRERVSSWYQSNITDDFKENLRWKRRNLDVTPTHLKKYHQTPFNKDFNLTDSLRNLQNEVCDTVIQKIESNINVKLSVHGIELQTWPIGSESSLHIHDAQGREKTDYNSLLYLNDDFDGGEFFTENGISVKPSPGRLTFFDGSKIKHGINRIYNGNRFTMIFWWKNTKFK